MAKYEFPEEVEQAFEEFRVAVDELRLRDVPDEDIRAEFEDSMSFKIRRGRLGGEIVGGPNDGAVDVVWKDDSLQA